MWPSCKLAHFVVPDDVLGTELLVAAILPELTRERTEQAQGLVLSLLVQLQQSLASPGLVLARRVDQGQDPVQQKTPAGT